MFPIIKLQQAAATPAVPAAVIIWGICHNFQLNCTILSWARSDTHWNRISKQCLSKKNWKFFHKFSFTIFFCDSFDMHYSILLDFQAFSKIRSYSANKRNFTKPKFQIQIGIAQYRVRHKSWYRLRRLYWGSEWPHKNLILFCKQDF